MNLPFIPQVLACVQAGSFSTNQVFFFGFVPKEVTGLVLRASNVVVSVTQPASTHDFWTLQYGAWSPGSFQPSASQSLRNGVGSAGLRFSFPDGSVVPRGVVFALRAVQSGQPHPIEGLSVAVEYGIVGER